MPSARKTLPLVPLLLMGAALGLVALAPLGWRLGWWHYGFGLYRLIPAAGVSGSAAVLLALRTLAYGRHSLAPVAIALLLAVAVLGAGVAYVPLRLAYARAVLPPINDISTDTGDRPAFKAVLAARAQESVDRIDTAEPKLSQLQKVGYPDIAPVFCTLPAHDAFELALKAARSMPGWIIVAANTGDGHIEASQRTRWFGFTDDVVIRVRSGRDAGNGVSRIDVRSASRKGTRDYGVNAGRIRIYLGRLRALVGALDGAAPRRPR